MHIRLYNNYKLLFVFFNPIFLNKDHSTFVLNDFPFLFDFIHDLIGDFHCKF